MVDAGAGFVVALALDFVFQHVAGEGPVGAVVERGVAWGEVEQVAHGAAEGDAGLWEGGGGGYEDV